MTADDSVYRLGKLCNPDLTRRRAGVRWLRGRTYQAERKVERLTHAWPDPDRRTPAQQAAIKQAELYAASCRAALAHHVELLARDEPEDAA